MFMEGGYYICLDNLEDAGRIVSEFRISEWRLFEGIKRMYVVIPDDLAEKLSRSYLVEREPKPGVWV